MKTPTSSPIDKKEFLTKWLSSLQQYNSSNSSQSCSDTNKMPQIIAPTTTNTLSTIFQRKRAIKNSADMAMASTRTATSLWSRALISRARTDYYCHYSCNKQPVVLQTESNHKETCERLLLNAVKNTRKPRSTVMMKQRQRRRRINRKRAESGGIRMMSARKIAKRVVKRRTAVLRGLVPGGAAMDDVGLIREAVDYILSLKAQVDVMQCLADATTTTPHHQIPSSLINHLNDDKVVSP